MNPLFQTLADLHRKSPLRQRDFTIDYEKFLRLADASDGDQRELAEKELRLAEAESNGAFQIDRAKKSGLPERLRIAPTTTTNHKVLGKRISIASIRNRRASSMEL